MKRPRVSIDINYNPYDENTGYARPPKIAACLQEYLYCIGYTAEDGGEFSELELQELLTNPDTFFAPLTDEQKIILRDKEYYISPDALQ